MDFYHVVCALLWQQTGKNPLSTFTDFKNKQNKILTKTIGLDKTVLRHQCEPNEAEVVTTCSLPGMSKQSNSTLLINLWAGNGCQVG